MNTAEVVNKLGVDIPDLVLQAHARGLERHPHGEAILRGRLLLWLTLQPNISQGGISITYTEEQRRQMQAEARQLFKRAGAKDDLDSIPAPPKYGYKANTL